MASDGEMNRFVHRILKASTAASVTGQSRASAVQRLVREIRHAKLLYFGEFHSEPRIVTFQTELIKEWSKWLASSTSDRPAARLHLIMEHFSVDMKPMLDRYQQQVGGGDDGAQSEDAAFEQLLSSYKEIVTEGHDLQSYRKLLQFCRQTTAPEHNADTACEVHIHGGFIPRNHAARLNKECPDADAKKTFFEEIAGERGYLPKEGEAMHSALFEGDGSSFRLRGSREHRLLIQSLMRGTDLYSPAKSDEGDEEEDAESPLSRLYQAQLLKDHAMGYQIAKLMLHHLDASHSSSADDRYLVIAGVGHLKHRLGVPDCVNGYLRQEAMSHFDKQRRAAAMDLLLSISCLPISTESGTAGRKFGGKGSALIASQMMYEAYIEEMYSDEDESESVMKQVLKDMYLEHPALLDEYLLKSEVISGPLLHYTDGIAGFEHPGADYLFVYDEDDDNVIDQEDLDDSCREARCSFTRQQSSGLGNAKAETADAYERVGKTAGTKGDSVRARAIMSQIGYTDDDIAYIGDDDIFNFQGVANPHQVAKIKPGEAVLDIGSGLGIDSFLSLKYSGADQHPPGSKSGSSAPFVVGVDLAESEVKHATKRAAERGYRVPEKCRFLRGDVEKLDAAFAANNVPMGQFDVCISNGAFCLVPNKQRAFEHLFKALKPGGRIAISTTTIQSDQLDPSHEWPVCMRMFASLESLKPMLEEIGYEDVKIVDAESPMEGMEIPEVECDGAQQRFKIHGRHADQYAWLEDHDMDALCKVVTVYAEKPLSEMKICLHPNDYVSDVSI